MSAPAVSQRPLWSYPVLSLLYKAFALTSMVVRVPLYPILFTLRPKWRPHPQWSVKQATLVRVVRLMVDMVSTTEMSVPGSMPLTPGREKGRFRVLEPYPVGFYRGPLDLTTGNVSPSQIGGVWYPEAVSTNTTLASDAKVILHLHGGAFVMGDGRSDYIGFACKTLLRHAGASAVFVPSYRLSCRPGCDPFPAALQDSLTSYLYLVRTLGIPPQRVVVSGDSAGGNLVVGLLRYLEEHGADLPEAVPPPAAAVLFSPWINLTRCSGPDAEAVITGNPHFNSDMVPSSFPRWGARVYCGDGAVPVEHPYVTPLGQPFATSVPIFVNWGSAEVLAIDGLQWTHEMASVPGNDVRAHHEEGAPHDTILLGDKYGFEDSARIVATRVRGFLEDVMQ